MAGPRMCACCYDKSRTDIGQFICPRCVEEWRIIRRLYSIAALHFDSIKKVSISGFVLLLWAKLGLDKVVKQGYNDGRNRKKAT